MKTFAFKNKLFLYYAALVTALVLGVVVVMEFFFIRMNRDLEIYQQSTVLRGDAVEISSAIDSMDALAQQVCSSNEFVNYFIPLSEDGDSQNYFERNLLHSIRASSQLATINSSVSTAGRISVYNSSGDYISTGRMFETDADIAASLADAGRYAGICREIDANEGGVYVSGAHGDDWSDNNQTRIVSLYRMLSPAYSSKSYGVVEVQMEAQSLLNMQWHDRSTRAETALFSADGALIYHNLEDIAALFDEEAGFLISGREAEDGIRVYRGRGFRIIAAEVEASGWMLMRYLPNAVLDEPYRNVYILLTAGCVVMLVLLLGAVYMMADKISRPLHSLSEAVGQVNLDNMQLAAVPQSGSTTKELLALDSAFRGMLSRLNQSIDLEMKAYMQALQSQMNPHFLYNMLSVIMETADEDGSAHTVAMCGKLSRMLRYAADYNGSKPVTMLDEVNHARNYLDLMKERYEDHFSYEIFIDPRAEEVRVPKIILQPLVENSFQHGFKSVRPPWKIRMSVTAEGSEWRVCVEDNGAGVTDEELAAIHQKIDTYRRNFVNQYDSLAIGGMGLVSTIVRLTLQRGDETFFEVVNRESGGVRVVIGGKI